MADRAVEQVMSEVQSGHDVTPLIQHLSPLEMRQFNDAVLKRGEGEHHGGGHAFDQVGKATIIYKEMNGGKELDAILFGGHSIYKALKEQKQGPDLFDRAMSAAPVDTGKEKRAALEKCMDDSRGTGKRGGVIGVDLALCKAEVGQ